MSEAATAAPKVHTPHGVRRRKIAGMSLGTYQRPVIAGNRGLGWRVAWYLVELACFRNGLLGLMPSAWQAAILRVFGAQVGQGLVCKPRVAIKYPWFLELGDHVWLGERVWIDNHCPVRIGSDVCISQGAYIFTGNHDWNDPRFRFYCEPVEIGDQCWIGAFAMVTPGTALARGEVLGAACRSQPARVRAGG